MAGNERDQKTSGKIVRSGWVAAGDWKAEYKRGWWETEEK